MLAATNDLGNVQLQHGTTHSDMPTKKRKLPAEEPSNTSPLATLPSIAASGHPSATKGNRPGDDPIIAYGGPSNNVSVYTTNNDADLISMAVRKSTACPACREQKVLIWLPTFAQFVDLQID